MCQVTENAIKNQATADSEKHRRNNGHDPMHALKGPGPAEPEEGNGQREGTDAGRGHLVLWGDVSVVVEIPRLVAVFPVEVGWDDDAAG